MAERRMFAKTIIDSDAFLDMPLSSQALYFHLSMRADDDGFINNPRRIMRTIGVADDDMKLLIAKKFILPFDSGIVVVKHWRIHNYIQADRYRETKYKSEKSMLLLDDNKAYSLATDAMDTQCIHDASSVDTQVRLGKDRLELGKDIGVRASRFTPPSIDDVSAYCKERNNRVDPQKFIDHYTSNGWMVGKNKMKDWKAAVRTWERNEYGKPKVKENPNSSLDLSAIENDGIYDTPTI